MSGTTSSPLLEVRKLHAHYGKSHILQGVDLKVGKGEVVSLLGRNGSGRSTTMKAVMGLLTPTSGAILLEGEDLTGERPYTICRSGIAFVPEEREVFANLTVDENLRMGEQPGHAGSPTWTIEQMFDYFPLLRQRRSTRAGHLSGGEQQMLTVCRSLLGNPKLILIDEPTEGLAPKIVTVVAEAIQDIHRRGVSVVLVEQKLTIALQISTTVCVLGHGRIVFEGSPQDLKDAPKVLKDWLAI
jgi:branched-chain amino acid transport system ATP-binding protein